MTNISPLPFKGDLIDLLKVHGILLKILWRDGEAYFPVRPVCDILGIASRPQRRKLTRADSDATGTFMVSVGADGKQREMLCLAYPDFMAWLINLTISRVKPEVRELLKDLKREIKVIIATYYHDRVFGEIQEREVCLQAMRQELMARKPSRIRVVEGGRLGWDFHTIWEKANLSRPKLVNMIKELIMLGLIVEAPKGTPFKQPEIDDNQLSLFKEA